MLAAAMVAGSVLAYGSLPERIPLHFDVAGTPGNYQATSPLTWFGTVGIALLLGGMCYALAVVLPRYPKLINVPDKRRFMALPREGQLRISRLGQTLLFGTTTFLLLLFGLVQYGSYQVAVGVSDGLPGSVSVAILGLIFTSMIMSPFVIIRMQKLQKEIEKEYDGSR
ncbi:hypothetical protein BH23BAC4_BH23BAC4_00150 [soil metagenome]